jgi:hypothetical protein
LLKGPYFIRVEDEVQFAHVLKAFIENFDEHLNQVQNSQLALSLIDHKNHVERGVDSGVRRSYL